MSEPFSINPEDINRFVADAIIKSSIGDAVKKAIDAEIGKLSHSWDNPEQARQSEFAGLRFGVFKRLRELEREEQRVLNRIDQLTELAK